MKKIKSLSLICLGLGALALVLSWLLIPTPRVDDFAVSPTLLDRHGVLYHPRLSADGEWLLPRPLADMGPWLPKVAVAVEDKRFYGHHGVDFLALGRAAWQNVRYRRVISGASTITVQVVRLSAPKDRTLWNKYVEFIGALKLSRRMGKDEIIEIYLNRAPFGGNLRGAEAAARHYFDKNAKDLSLGESALLVALLRGPSLYRPDRRPELARQRRDMILDSLMAKGTVTAEEVTAAKAEPVPGRKGSMPRRAWHFSESVMAEAGGPATWRWGENGRQYGLATSLDQDLQAVLEARLNRGLEAFPARITGAGAIMDNKNGRILAYVGNARWTGAAQNHWVDCGLARRSPGSTLKPFVYLAAFMREGLTPASLLADTPLKLSGQAPRNFDKYYRGPVSAQPALAESLNAPAVRVLRLAGTEKALAVLRRSGFAGLWRGGGFYGDSLVLGGCEVTLRQQLAAYGMLARRGLAVTPTWRGAGAEDHADHRPPVRLFPEGAVWLINECLKDDSRLPAGLRLVRENSGQEELAFKTGTSHGLRDAWLAAFTPAHTFVLWAGDPDGRAHPQLTALTTLGPVAAPLADDLAARFGSSPWPGPPGGVEKYQACPVSGQPAGPHCPGHYEAYRLAEGARTHPCRLHVLTGGRITAQWPPELSGFMSGLPDGEGGMDVRPPDSPGPVITSPPSGGTIVIEGREASLPLRCEGAKGEVHWFLNDEYYLSAKPDLSPTLTVTAGEHRITMIDQSGRTAGSAFTIMYSQEQDRDVNVPVLSFN